MYCIIGTEHPDDDHAFNEDKSQLGFDVTFDSTACKDAQTFPGDSTMQISYDICDAMFAKNRGDIAKMEAEAAAQAAALTSLKAGFTCNVAQNCKDGEDGAEAVCSKVAGPNGESADVLTCEIVPIYDLSDGSVKYPANEATACTPKTLYQMPDFTWRSPDACTAAADALAAQAEARKTCETTK